MFNQEKRPRIETSSTDEDESASYPTINGTHISNSFITNVDMCSSSKKKNSDSSETLFDLLKEKNINLKDLKFATIESLLDLGIGSYHECVKVMKQLKSEGIIEISKENNSKVFNDPIHGHIKFHPACLAIIDTLQFQRLRYIKQLGMCYYVYPGASHNRFEHSLGVCYLAGQFARTLQKNQPYLGITDKDILCVEIAGLCHDLGHGPFSHMFDGKFIPAVCPGANWKHEKASIDMLDFLIEENKLIGPDGMLTKYGLDNRDILFIKEQIYGPLDDSGTLNGRDKYKYYLYEIVANKRNGIDVDKWDYFARDCHHLGMKNNFDHFRFMKFARVIEVDGEWQICTRDKEIDNIYNMFYTRYSLHKTAYQHKVSNAIETMIVHAFIIANKYMEFTRKDGTKCKLSECIDDMHAFAQLTDNVLFKILYLDHPAPEVQEAKNIIQRVFTRDLYTCVYESIPLESNCLSKTADDILTDIMTKGHEISEYDFTLADIVVQIAYLDFGMQNQNPLEKLLVYSKHQEDVARLLPRSEASQILRPMTFSELLIRVYSCDRDPLKCECLAKAAQFWFEETQRGWHEALSTPEKERCDERLQLTPRSAGKHRTRYSSFDLNL